MRHLWVVALLGAAACTPQAVSRPPPTDAFYFPSGIWYVDSPSSPQGMLFVASANYDKRYDAGSVIAVPLSGVAGGSGLPAINTQSSTSPVKIEDLGPGVSQVAIQSFAGEMAGYPLADGRTRLFIPTRAEGDLLEIVDSQDGSLTCLNGGTNCIDPSFSLTAVETVAGGKPRAPEPVGVGVSRDGQVYVTHLRPADSPARTNQSLETYAVNVAAENPVIDANSSFISLGRVDLGLGPTTSSVAVGSKYAYLSSRYFGPGGAMIWVLSRGGLLYLASLESNYRTLEARGVAIGQDEHGQDERRLYVAGRSPDTLVVVDLMNAGTDTPTLRVVRAVPLPEGPNQVRVIPRARGLGNLVVVTSSGPAATPTAGVVSIYDDGVGRLVAQLSNVGVQPFGLAVRTQKDAQMRDQARIFVSNFGDGRIAVIDLKDLARPQDLELQAYLGKQQTCLVQDQDASCVGVSP